MQMDDMSIGDQQAQGKYSFMGLVHLSRDSWVSIPMPKDAPNGCPITHNPISIPFLFIFIFVSQKHPGIPLLTHTKQHDVSNVHLTTSIHQVSLSTTNRPTNLKANSQGQTCKEKVSNMTKSVKWNGVISTKRKARSKNKTGHNQTM